MDALRRVLQNSGQLTAQPSPYQAIRQAASETGTDFDYLWRTAKRESGLDPSARASTSSATGLFQFTNQTWLSMVGNCLPWLATASLGQPWPAIVVHGQPW